MIWKIAVGFLVVVLAVFALSFRIQSTTEVEATLDAPVERVWAMWNEPEQIKKWWGPHKYSSPEVQNDLRVGGKYLLAMLSPSNDLNYNGGVYTEIIEHKKIVSDMYFSDAQGNPLQGDQIKVPGNWPDTVKLTVEFTSQGDKTHVRVVEIGTPLVMKFFSTLGWQQQFEKMAVLLKGS